jgi:uncharacterized protein (TIGR00730 family)
MRSVCVFCGSSPGARPEYLEAARETGTSIARRGWRLVYGGGKVGLMGVVADAALAAGGEVVGVIPHALERREVGHSGVTELRVVRSMHERKQLMAELSDGFVALPGGFGTWEEFCEVATWVQLGIHRKPCGVLNVSGYYDSLLAFFDHAVAERFVSDVHRANVIHDTSPTRLLDRLAVYVPPLADKWLDRDEA